MPKPAKEMSALEFVWEHRLRQRILLERIILTVGNAREQTRAKHFLESMEKANPKLLDDIDHYTPEFLEEYQPRTPELFDNSEYCPARGRKTALKFPKDILWEERIIRRAAKEYRELFHPCESLFNNAMKGLQYLNSLHPELFARARAQAIEQRDQILSFEIYCKCDCASREERQPADSFKITDRGRFRVTSQRIARAGQSMQNNGGRDRDKWQFFLDRIGEVAPEMLESSPLDH